MRLEYFQETQRFLQSTTFPYFCSWKEISAFSRISWHCLTTFVTLKLVSPFICVASSFSLLRNIVVFYQPFASLTSSRCLFTNFSASFDDRCASVLICSNNVSSFSFKLRCRFSSSFYCSKHQWKYGTVTCLVLILTKI